MDSETKRQTFKKVQDETEESTNQSKREEYVENRASILIYQKATNLENPERKLVYIYKKKVPWSSRNQNKI